MKLELDNSDGFNQIPDPLIYLIFNQISDIKGIIRCRSVSKRFNSFVPQEDSLCLQVDRVISATNSDDYDDSFIALLRSISKFLHHFFSSSKPLRTRPDLKICPPRSCTISRISGTFKSRFALVIFG